MAYTGDCRLGDLFENRRERGRPGLPLLSVTMNDGLVDRDDLDRKQDTNLAPEDHLLVNPGDIAYNMMRMWQGAFGLADKNGLVSPAYVVLRPTHRIDPNFAAHLLSTPRLLYLLWAYSHGITDDRLRLYYADFSRIKVRIPPLVEQQRIATILKCWDDAIASAERLVNIAQRQKLALMQRLLPRIQTKHSPPSGWVQTRLGDHVVVSPRRPDRPKDGLVSFLPMEAVSETGKLLGRLTRKYEDVCSGYSSFAEGDVIVAKITPCFENGKGALLSGLKNDVGFGSTEFHVLRPLPGIEPRLLAYITNSHEFRRRGESEMEGSAGQKRVSADFIRNFRFTCPSSSSAQRKIADMLDLADKLMDAYQNKTQTLNHEKSAIVQRLLSGYLI